MSDFDERLSAVLTAGAADAPHGTGLVEAARRRHAARRRRRIAAGGVAAALGIAAPALVLASGGSGDDRTANDPAPPAPAWQTVEEGEARVEIPGDWSRHTCDFDGFESHIFGPSEEDACGFEGASAAFYGSATFDAAELPGVVQRDDGLWGGYVTAGNWVVWAGTPDRALTLQILASFRLEGQPKVVADDWISSFVGGKRYERPSGWGVDGGFESGYVVEEMRAFYVGPERGRQLDPSHYQRLDNSVIVTGPTRAVVDLVWETIDRGDAGDQ